MAVQLELKKYHHMVILAKDCREAVETWAKVFGFPVPHINEPAKDRDPEQEKAYRESGYPCLYRGSWWRSDFLQAVFPQETYFFEINGVGQESDCFIEYKEKHGCGICYIGIVAAEKRDAFIEYANRELGCDTIVEQKIPIPGYGVIDWTVMETDQILGTNICVKENPGGDHTVNPVVPDFAGMFLLVPDAELAAEGWRKLFSDVQVNVSYRDCQIERDGRTVTEKVKTAEVLGGRFPIWLLEPSCQPFEEYVKSHGYGNYAIVLPDDEQGSKASALRENDMREQYRMGLCGKNFTMFETVLKMGTNIAVC